MLGRRKGWHISVFLAFTKHPLSAVHWGGQAAVLTKALWSTGVDVGDDGVHERCFPSESIFEDLAQSLRVIAVSHGGGLFGSTSVLWCFFFLFPFLYGIPPSNFLYRPDNCIFSPFPVCMKCAASSTSSLHSCVHAGVLLKLMQSPILRSS